MMQWVSYIINVVTNGPLGMSVTAIQRELKDVNRNITANREAINNIRADLARTNASFVSVIARVTALEGGTPKPHCFTAAGRPLGPQQVKEQQGGESRLGGAHVGSLLV